MKRFVELFHAVDRTTRTSEKTAALRSYFEEAPPEDAVWALRVLTGQKLGRAVPYPRLKKWAGAAAGLEPWLFDACHDAVGDLSETLALVLPDPADPQDLPLHAVVAQHLLPLAQLPEAEQHAAVRTAWDRLGRDERFVLHKLISGNFRFGAAKKVVINALAAAAGVEPAVMQHRLGGRPVEPTARAFAALLAGGEDDPARPYPFYLAAPLGQDPAALGDAADWWVEWKWDGIRAQIIRRGNTTLVWSRGDELITDAFPELRAAGDGLPDGTVLDGELLAWEHDRPLPFNALQKRLNRKRMEPVLFADVPVVFMAYDVLEDRGVDVREESTDARRGRLERLCPEDPALMISPRVEAGWWPAYAALRAESRARGVEGLMLKHKDAPYRAGRVRGAWWKWKVDPYTVDAVMVYAQRGRGRRAALFTDYTFAVWSGEQPGQGELVPVAKAYSGLTDDEFTRVDAFIKRHTLGKQGAFRAVEPVQVFEIAFEGLQESTRHKSGVALRFPRMNRWRTDKKAQDADTLAAVRGLLDVTR